MRWFAGMALGLFSLLSLSLLTSGTVAAGEYFYGNGGGYGGYGSYGGGNVWYSSSCCYRKVVKHVRRVAYVRSFGDGYYAPRYRSSYYDGGGYYGGYSG